jgi:hypothetical protein
VSIDHPDAERHDAGRGWGNFRRALEGLALLHQRGFPVSVIRQGTPGDDETAIAAAFRSVFTKAGLPADLRVLALPDYGLPGQLPASMAVSETVLAERRSNSSQPGLMCTHSKMLIKRNGALRVYACPLVDDAQDFDQGATLTEALARDASLKHARCLSCVRTGTSWSALQ